MSRKEHFPFQFSSTKGRRIKAAFDGGQISSDAGVLLVREADRRLNLTKSLSRLVEDKRRCGSVEHSVESMVRQRVYGLCADYEDLVDFDELRNDPLWQCACGKEDVLAGKSTLSRFESRADRRLAFEANALLVESFIDSFAEAPEELVLDFDATDDPVHGHQEGRFFHGYYGHYCFLPLYVFCGDRLLTAYLRPSDRDAALHSGAILKLLVTRLRRQWPHVRIIFRGDSGFCRDRTLAWCDRNNVDYVVGLARNDVLLREISVLMEQARVEHERTGQKQRLFGGYIYGAKTWTLKRHVIAKAEHSDKGANPRFVVTSLEGNEQDIYEKIYCARGEMENRIKEQMTLFSDRTSAGLWWTNQWRLILSAYAYTLWECVRRVGLEGTKFVRAQCATLRLKFLKIGTLVQKGSRVLRLRLPSAFPHKELFIQAVARLRPT